MVVVVIVVECVCKDLAVELFNLETSNFQERQYFIC